jgi:soluble lytic murein transglycosylase
MARRSIRGAAAALAIVLLAAGSGVRAQEGMVPPDEPAEDAPAHETVSEPGAPQVPLLQSASVAAPVGPPPVVAGGEIARLREGILAAQVRNWDGVRNARAMARDPLVKRILQWRIASDMDAPASFEELRTALDQLPGWPGRETMRRRAEQSIFDASLSPAERVAWLRAGGPLSGDGKVALAQALKIQGRRDEAVAVLRDAWRVNSITPRAEALALSDMSDMLRSSDHAARVDWALWRDDRGLANRLVPRLGPEDATVARARIVLQTRPRKGLQAAVDRVPASRRDDAGFLYDRVRYYRVTNRPELALPIAARIDPTATPAVAKEPLFKERRRYVPRALREGNRTQAYNLVKDHGVASGGGETFAEAEWLAGWLALRFTRDAAAADRHFAQMDAGVSTPISKARAAYWRAMATKTLGKTAEADAFLAESAKYNFTYYGLLAATKANRDAQLSLGERIAIAPAERAAFESKEVVRALRLVGQASDEKDFESFAYYLDDQLQTPAEHEMLSQIAREQAYTRIAVRSAKAGIRRGIMAPDAAYPLLDLPPDARKPGRPEPALILAITRQESEFDPRAVSRARAYGLMQLIDATARATARQEGLPYQRAWLLDDPSYNITLGAAHLQQLLEEWNGSYVLTIASYNAGPGRPREWIGDWGDPRSRGVDVVDWVELIPFSETRNYVQRVIENVQIYRHRLAGAPVPVRIEQDLRRGAT